MIFDFKCSKGHKEEYWVKSSVRTVRCKVCDEEATRCISGAMVSLDPISGDFPGATMKWAKHHERAAKQSSE
jgi:hypothetical protein